MKKHNGMRPQDIVILLRISTLKEQPWFGKDLASFLSISSSEVSESLNRSSLAGLLDDSKKKLMKQSFLEFLEFGFKYVFPLRPGYLVRGFPTAHSAPPLTQLIQSKEMYVWPDAHGEHLGQAIEPLHPGIVKAAKNDLDFYEIISLADALRIGRTREQGFAIQEIRKRI
jgi:hypothetical protein